MSERIDFEYVRSIGFPQAGSLDRDKRYSHVLIDHESGGRHCSISWTHTPPGGGSLAGLHTHDVDQIFFIVHGTMNIEVDGRIMEATAGSLVIFPASIPHRNWNESQEPVVYIAINAPMPDSTKPFSMQVKID